MARIRCKGWSFVVALAAAWMLVLQSVAGAPATGAGSHQAGFDAFGNALCITSAAYAAQPGPQGDGHDASSDCCMPGCSISAAALPPAPVLLAAGWPREPRMAAAPAEAATGGAPDYEPGNPRAPPLTA